MARTLAPTYEIKHFQDATPGKGMFTEKRVLGHPHEQIDLNGRDVILDTRGLSGESIGTLRRILADPQRAAWRDPVLWYDGGP